MNLFDTPGWLPLEFEPAADQVKWLRLDEADYRAASFLDFRIVEPDSDIMHSAWPTAPAQARRDAHYIFHIGNVGSTLISRLLGELPDVFAVREPQLLRQLAADADFATVAALLSRTWRPGQRANVKATSFTSELADRLIQPGSNALFLYITPERYLESILAGQNSWTTLEALSAIRLERLRSRCPDLELDLARANDAIKAALGWACEATSLERAASGLPAGTVLWMDFDIFLADPAEHLLAIARHYAIELDAAGARRLCDGPLMRRYSKALDYEFSPAMRREILGDSRRRHAPEIAEALRWLGALGSRYPAIARAIRRASGER